MDHEPPRDQEIPDLWGPAPLAHSQELAQCLPVIRHHVGPRAWYQCLESVPTLRK